MTRSAAYLGRNPRLEASVLRDLRRLVECESPSSDTAALRRCAGLVSDIAGEWRLKATASEASGKPVLHIGDAHAPVLLLAHLDTVHPIGTIERVPFLVGDGRVTGPGVFDMKAGLLQGMHVVRESDGMASLLVTSDEEIGLPGARPVIEASATGKSAVLVLEPSSGGRVKVARKGYSLYDLHFHGKAAHAGLEPEKGANATEALAHAVLEIAALRQPAEGTTITPTAVTSGTVKNTVPARAVLAVDVRAPSAAAQQWADARIRMLASQVPGVSISVTGGINRPPMERPISARLFGLARQAAAEIGLADLEGEAVGGVSDGNFSAALGVETLDGLGAVGAGAHTDQEWADVTALLDRTALLIRLVELIGESR